MQYGGFWFLVGFRLLQGIAGAFTISTAMSLGTIVVEEKDLSAVAALTLLCFALGTAIGPSIGGVLV